MKAEQYKLRLRILSGVVILLLSVLLIRLAVLQLFYNDLYQTQAKENSIRLVSVKAPRGEIYTRDGETLASNKLVYTLNLSSLESNQDEEVIERLVQLLNKHYPEITVESINEKIELQKFRLYEPVTIIRDIPWELVVHIEENRSIYQGVMITVEPLRSYPQGELAGHLLGYIHSINPQELSAESGKEYTLNSLIGKSGIEKSYERYLRGKDGARRIEVDARNVPIPVQEQITLEPEPGYNLYLSIDMKLQKVLDQSMSQVLTTLQGSYPKAKVGSAVVMNVKTGEILAMTSMPPINPDDWKGNLASSKVDYYYPQGKYDPLNPGAEQNRAIQATYPPGSTFKPITGMAALDKGALNSVYDSVNCGGAYWIAPYTRCTGVHGNMNYYNGMAKSCNTFFQEIGRRATKDEIIRVADQFGLGSKTGIDLPDESQGLLPTPAWKKEINAILTDQKYDHLRKELNNKYELLLKEAANSDERDKIERQRHNEEVKLEAQYNIDYNFDTTWQSFDTFNMSIGQGYNNYTVIQLANYTATIGNGGQLMQPYIVKRIVEPNGKTIQEFKPKVIHRVDVSSQTIAETKRAMLAVTQPGGTAHFLFYQFPPEIQVAAKTGTAQTGRQGDIAMKEFHGVFIAFAPFDDPEIAFAGVVEYGYSGGGSAGLVCRDVFEQYFGIKNHLTEEEPIVSNQKAE